jgi:uncharacterized protein
MTFRGRRSRSLSLAAVAALLVSGCGAPGAATSCDPPARPLVIATGSPGGVYAALGDQLAGMLASSTPLAARAVNTGSTLRNVQQLATGEYDVAFAQADGAADAVRGQGVFAEPQKLRALGRIYSDYTQVVVSSASGITAMDGFRGKKISTGAAQSGTELIAGRLLAAAGLDRTRDVQAQALDLPGSVAALQAGTIDGFVWSGGLPTRAVADLFASGAGRYKLIDVGGLLPALQRQDDAYAAADVPSGTYGSTAAVSTITMPNLLLVRDDFPDAAACAVTRTLFTNREALARTVPAAAGLDPKAASDTAPVELNAGARTALSQLPS